jgi:hypothetical protein
MNKFDTSIETEEALMTERQRSLDSFNKTRCNSNMMIKKHSQQKYVYDDDDDDDDEFVTNIPCMIVVRSPIRRQVSDISLDFALLDFDDDSDNDNDHVQRSYTYNERIRTSPSVWNDEVTATTRRRLSGRSSCRSSQTSIDDTTSCDRLISTRFYRKDSYKHIILKHNNNTTCSNDTAAIDDDDNEKRLMILSMSSRTTKSSQISSSMDELFRCNSNHDPSPKMPLRKLSSDQLVDLL